MLTKIAWRNIWRQKTRSLVIMLAIVVGLSGLLFLIGFMGGFTHSYLETAIKYEYSHIQVHHQEFKKDQDIKFVIQDGIAKAREIQNLPDVEAVSYRTVVNGMISSAKATSGVKVLGVDTLLEKRITSFDQLMVEGTFFGTNGRNPVVIGQKLATRLKVKLRSKIVITFQNQHGEIASGAFRVVGIFNAKSPKLNEGTIMVNINDLKKSLNGEEVINEIAVLLKDELTIDQSIEEVANILPEDKIEKWSEIAPEIKLIVEQSGIQIYILAIIFMTALIFGIINTMLMAVLERIRELGMMKAIGMNKNKIFFMIVIETIYLGFVASPVGLLLGYLALKFTGNSGIDLSAYSKGLDDMGYDSVVFPTIDPEYFVIMTIGIFVTVLLASIYPAVKAIRLKPIEAIRTI